MKEPKDFENGNGTQTEKRPIYVVRIPKEEIRSLQKSEKFILILRLCRYRNQILYCKRGFLDHWNDLSPEGVRQRFNSIWFLIAVLNESLRIIPELGKEFRHFPSYQKGFAMFLRDSKLTALRNKLFTPMRNQLVFHVDNAAIEKSFETYDVETYEFITWSPEDDRSLFYPLADEIVLNAFIESDENHTSKRWPFEELLEDVSGYVNHYSHCVDDLIKEYVNRKRWVAVEDSEFFGPKDEEDLEEYIAHFGEKYDLDQS